MKLVKTIGTALLLSALLVALAGCSKQEGPAEKVGKDLDNAAKSVGDQVDKAGKAIKDAANGDNN
jgi:PBP1b-binding outer membrane lipoprotein LpoB